MKIYLDNNIFIYLEEQKISLSNLEDLVGSKISKIYYSSVHIQETLEIRAQTEKQRMDWINQRLNTISHVTNDDYLNEGLDNIIREFKESPFKVYKTITEVPFAQASMKGLVNLIDEETREHTRQTLGIDSQKISNLEPIDLLEEFDKIFSKIGVGSFLDFLELSMTYHPGHKSFGLSNRIAGLFEVLDILGYFKDKFNEKSNYARQSDSNHCSYASVCDAFISNDRRMINKAKIAFKVYNIDTKILYPKL